MKTKTVKDETPEEALVRMFEKLGCTIVDCTPCTKSRPKQKNI